MPALYEIDAALLDLLAHLDDDGEIGEDPLAAIDALSMARVDKLDAICRYVRDRSTRAVALQAELDRLQAAKKTEDNAVDRLKKYIHASMTALGEQKIETPLFKLRIQKNSQPSVLIEDDKALPEWAKRVKVEADRTAILAKYKADGTLPDGVEVQTGTHLRIS